jgi:hypothetical protein
MLRPEVQKRHDLLGGDERVRDHAPVVKRHAGYCVTVDEREQNLPMKLGRIIQRG